MSLPFAQVVSQCAVCILTQLQPNAELDVARKPTNVVRILNLTALTVTDPAYSLANQDSGERPS
jgi:hypothetical protein